MNIILLNMASDTRYDEIVEWIVPAIDCPLFRIRGEIKNINLIEVQDKETKEIEYQGFVRIEPDILALRAIENLSGKTLKERTITVRQYYRRQFYNDKQDESIEMFTGSIDVQKYSMRRNLEKIEVPLFSNFHVSILN